MIEIEKNNITVFHLGTCGHCGRLMTLLDTESIEYRKVDANVEQKVADKVEDFIGIQRYPIVLVIDNMTLTQPSYLFIANNNDELGTKQVKGAVRIGYNSVEEMVSYIQKFK